MKRLAPADVETDLTRYERIREQERGRIIALKKRRRVELGPMASLVFENRETVRFQIQEVVRLQRIVDPARIRAEIDTFNEILPGDGEIAATLMIEIDDPGRLGGQGALLVGLEKHLALVLGERHIAALPSRAERGEGKGFDAIRYVRFPIDETSRTWLASGRREATVQISSPSYAATAWLPAETIAEILEDLAP